MSSDQLGDDAAATAVAVPATRSRSPRRTLGIVVLAVLVLNVVAFVLFPPFPAGGSPGDECPFPACYIEGNLEFPAPHVIWQPPGSPPPSNQPVTFEVSITSTIVTMWVVSMIALVVAILMARGRRDVPGRMQNFGEWAYESLENFGLGLGGPTAKPYIPLFAAFFVYILFCNYSGLIPVVGKVEFLRAPTSDVNITIGLALVAFGFFEIEGFRRLGGRGYLGKFFPLYEFRSGFSAGLIAMFVGLVELMLEFVKPLTLSMRLFGNIYGGEVALGVMTALTITFIPVALLGLEFMLNFIQALIFARPHPHVHGPRHREPSP